MIKTKISVKEEWKVSSDKYGCPYCQKEYSKKGIGNHIWRAHTEEGEKHNPNRGYANGTREGWCKGLTKETDERVKKSAQSCSTSVKGKTRKPLTAQHRANVSKGRIKYLEENPDKVPYLLNHSSKGPSYPERYFKDLFEKEEIEVAQYYRVSLYEIDFANLKNKIAIEIDGEQHHLDERVVQSDVRKNRCLESNDWSVYRIRWAEWQKKTMEDKTIIITELKKLTK